MSEYQYYEFQAIDRPLTKDELKGVRALSSRARISATRFVNEYRYGNFRGDERKLMEQLYDAHLYFANWGSRRLMLRLPTTLLPARSAEPYCAEDALTCWTRKGHLLLDFSYEAEDGGEWDFETSFTLASFTTLRTELAAGDLRPLYLAWLSALTRWELEEDVDEDEYTSTLEPPVPTGLAHLTGPQHQRPRAEGGQLLVQGGADPRDLALGDTGVRPQGHDQVVDRPGGPREAIPHCLRTSRAPQNHPPINKVFVNMPP